MKSINEVEAHPLVLDISKESPSFLYAHISVPAFLVAAVYEQAVMHQQATFIAPGFQKGAVPLDYIRNHMKGALHEHIKDFLLSYCVTPFLYNELRSKKIVCVGQPRLHETNIVPPHQASFTFEISIVPPVALHDWKYYSFKMPKRKNYKDLDRQVDHFISEEKNNSKSCDVTRITIGDWVNFDIALVDEHGMPLSGSIHENYWLKMGDEEMDGALREPFLHKYPGSSFIASNRSIQDYFSSHVITNYQFKIDIKDVIKHAFFSLEDFNRYFKIKNHKEVNQKLIEVFSYRNDISLRRNISEEALKLIVNKHAFFPPKHCVLRRKGDLLELISGSPDYHVYRSQPDFSLRLDQLAEKQTKSLILIDHIAYKDNLAVQDHDLKGYLTLTQRPRTKEFIYFDTPLNKKNGQERPFSSSILKQSCLREKTINHIINTLTQK